MECCASTANPPSPILPSAPEVPGPYRAHPEMHLKYPQIRHPKRVRQNKRPCLPRMGAAGLLTIRPCARSKRRCKRNSKLVPYPMPICPSLYRTTIQRGCQSYDRSPSLLPRRPTTKGHWCLRGQPKIGTSRSQPHEHNGTGRVPSAYRPVPLKKSMSAQLPSQSGTPAPSSHSMARTMSASGPAPGAGSRDRPRKHPPTTQRTNQAQVADGDDNQQFTSTLRTVLSRQNRYAPGLYLVT